MAYKLPDEVSTLEGCLLEPLAVGLHGAARAGVGLGDNVVIIGAGCVGLTLLLACKARGAAKVILIDIFDNRLAKALELGATAVVNSKNEDPAAKVAELLGGGAHVVFEAVGSPATVAVSYTHLAFIRRIREAMDMSVIFISHKIEEVFSISDTIAIFTDGRLVLTSAAADISREACIRAMLRSAKLKTIGAPSRDVSGRAPILEVEDLRYDGSEHHLGLEVRPGEIVGCYGLVGSGRTECAEALYGLRRIEGGSYRFAGGQISKCSPEQMIARGMILTPEIRQNAIFKTFSLQDNICLLYTSRCV